MERPLRSDLEFTPAVKEAQRARGSRQAYAAALARRDWPATIDSALAAFIAERDTLYLGTASAEGQPTIQHRGGPRGFLKVLDASRLAFADYSGNRQYISLGNLRSHSESRCRWIRRRFWFQAAFDVREWAQRPMTEQKTSLGPEDTRKHGIYFPNGFSARTHGPSSS